MNVERMIEQLQARKVNAIAVYENEIKGIEAAITLITDMNNAEASGNGRTNGHTRLSARAARATAPDEAPSGKRKRSTMTASQRKAVSARMKKYWAGRRKSAKN